MAVISMKQLLEAGVHFGHQTRRWNPKMKRYIFTERNGIYIIDLQKTVKLVDDAYNYMREVAQDGGIALFVGTKKQAQEAVKEEALNRRALQVKELIASDYTDIKSVVNPDVGDIANIKIIRERYDLDIVQAKELWESIRDEVKQ